MTYQDRASEKQRFSIKLRKDHAKTNIPENKAGPPSKHVSDFRGYQGYQGSNKNVAKGVIEPESNRGSWKKVGKEVYQGLEQDADIQLHVMSSRDEEDEVEYQFDGLEKRGTSPLKSDAAYATVN